MQKGIQIRGYVAKVVDVNVGYSDVAGVVIYPYKAPKKDKREESIVVFVLRNVCLYHLTPCSTYIYDIWLNTIFR